MQHYALMRMELKYCERCGGLLLRASGSAQIYCGRCGQQMAELPLRPARKKMAAPVQRAAIEASAEVLLCQ
jgi:ribosomal protein S27AE